MIQTTDSMTFPVLEIVGKTATQMARTVDSIKLEMTNVMTREISTMKHGLHGCENAGNTKDDCERFTDS